MFLICCLTDSSSHCTNSCCIALRSDHVTGQHVLPSYTHTLVYGVWVERNDSRSFEMPYVVRTTQRKGTTSWNCRPTFISSLSFHVFWKKLNFILPSVLFPLWLRYCQWVRMFNLWKWTDWWWGSVRYCEKFLVVMIIMRHNDDALAVIRFFFFNTCQWRFFLRQQISDCGSDVRKNHNCSQSYEKGFFGGGKGGNNSELWTKLWDRTESSFCQGAEQNTARVVCSGTSCRETVITLFRLKGESKTHRHVVL